MFLSNSFKISTLIIKLKSSSAARFSSTYNYNQAALSGLLSSLFLQKVFLQYNNTSEPLPQPPSFGYNMYKPCSKVQPRFLKSAAIGEVENSRNNFKIDFMSGGG